MNRLEEYVEEQDGEYGKVMTQNLATSIAEILQLNPGEVGTQAARNTLSKSLEYAEDAEDANVLNKLAREIRDEPWTRDAPNYRNIIDPVLNTLD